MPQTITDVERKFRNWVQRSGLNAIGGEVMPHDEHLFISYAHHDNKPLTPKQEGWVTRFHASLQTILTMRMGPHAQIWRDKKLSGNDCFADEILAQFQNTRILISVLSKCYVESEWCRREIEEFCRRCGDIRIGNKYRVLKVLKLPLDSTGPLPPFMKDMLGYEFFTYQDRDARKTPMELDPLYFPDLASLYIEKLYVLADDIKEMIERMAGATLSADTVQPTRSRPKIFLAQCSRDQKEIREALAIDLKQHGYQMLPDRQLPNEEQEFITEVTQALAECSLSIHLVGGFSGFVPDGPSRKSAVILQNELAIAQAKASELRRVIWLPDGTVSQDPDQKQFLEALHRDAETQFGADLISGTLESLKATIHSTLQRLEKKEPTLGAEAKAPSSSKLVYLICDERDREAVLPLRKLLKNKGFEVKIPVFAGDAATVDNSKREMLAKCDAALVFYGKGDEGWKRAVDSDLLKSKGYRGDKAPLAQLTYLSTPVTTEKTEMIELEEANVINGLEGFSDVAVTAMLEALHRA